MISIMKVVEATDLTTVSLATHETLYKLLSLRILCWSVGGGRVEYIMYPYRDRLTLNLISRSS